MYDAYGNDEDDRYDSDRPATEAEAHLEWHRNAGVPVGQPCPWDACDPYADEPHDDEPITGDDVRNHPVFAALSSEAREVIARNVPDPDDLPF